MPRGYRPGEEDREERDHGQHEERQPEECEDDVVRDREEPLHEPEPTAEVGSSSPSIRTGYAWVFTCLFQSVHPYDACLSIGALGARRALMWCRDEDEVRNDP